MAVLFHSKQKLLNVFSKKNSKLSMKSFFSLLLFYQRFGDYLEAFAEMERILKLFLRFN